MITREAMRITMEISLGRYSHLVDEMTQASRNTDWENAHIRADDLLVSLVGELGLHEITDQYKKVGKWYA